MPVGLPPTAELTTGRYYLAVDLPDAVLDTLASRPRWREALQAEIARRASSASVVVLGGGTAWDTNEEGESVKVWGLSFEVLPFGSTGRDDDATLRTVAVSYVALGVILLAIAAVAGYTGTSIYDRYYRLKLLEAGEDPHGGSSWPGAASAWASALTVGAIAWLVVRLSNRGSS